MNAHPELSCATGAKQQQDETEDDEQEAAKQSDDDAEANDAEQSHDNLVNGANWAMHRLSYIAISTKRTKVKRAVFTVFMNLIQQESAEFLERNFRHMLADRKSTRLNSRH